MYAMSDKQMNEEVQRRNDHEAGIDVIADEILLSDLCRDCTKNNCFPSCKGTDVEHDESGHLVEHCDEFEYTKAEEEI